MLSVILRSVIMLSALILNIVLLNVILLSVITPSDMMLRVHYAECHFASVILLC